MIEDQLFLTLGAKLEHYDDTGLEILPTIRLNWLPNEKHSFWAAVSRSTRTPSDYELTDDISIVNFTFPTFAPPFVGAATVIGDDDIDSEVLYAYELGYRFQPNDKISIETSAYFNQYTDNISITSFDPFGPTIPTPDFTAFPQYLVNGSEIYIYGFELSTAYQVSDELKFILSYSFAKADIDTEPGLSQPGALTLPESMLHFRTYWQITDKLHLTLFARYVSKIPDIMGVNSYEIPAYVSLGFNLNFKVNDKLNVYIGGDNLTDDRHPEEIDSSSIAGDAPRYIYLGFKYSF